MIDDRRIQDPEEKESYEINPPQHIHAIDYAENTYIGDEKNKGPDVERKIRKDLKLLEEIQPKMGIS